MAVESETRELNGSEGRRAFLGVNAERVTGFSSQRAEGTLAVEEPLEIQLGYGPAGSRAVKSISVTMRTPGYDFELAAGFLMTEGVVRDSNDIDDIFYTAHSNMHDIEKDGAGLTTLPYQPEKNIVRVELSTSATVSLANLERNFIRHPAAESAEKLHCWRWRQFVRRAGTIISPSALKSSICCLLGFARRNACLTALGAFTARDSSMSPAICSRCART